VGSGTKALWYDGEQWHDIFTPEFLDPLVVDFFGCWVSEDGALFAVGLQGVIAKYALADTTP
jgi:hypothetical protein